MNTSGSTVELEISLERLRSLQGTKWARDGADHWPAWVADTDITPPAVAIDAVRRLVEVGDFGYGQRANGLLADAFAAFTEAEHGWRPDTERLQIFSNVLQAIEMTLYLHTEPGDGVVRFTPIYPPFIAGIESGGRRVVDCLLDEASGWRLDAERLESVIDEGTKAILMCNPHNPTGRIFDRSELEAIAEVAERHDLLVIADEVWSGLTHPGKDHLAFPLISETAANRTVTVGSASKSFNLAGLRCAIAHLGHPGVEAAYASLPTHLLGGVNVLGTAATLAVWNEGRPYLDAVRSHLTTVRDHVARRIANDLPGVSWHLPEATYLGWLDFRQAGLGPDPSAVLFERGKVALSPGPDFGRHGTGFARLNFATSIPIIDTILDRIAETVDDVSSMTTW
ncbi:MAG: aminotransferase class I/II-fold pyridoxal phosphate-dependent enzyme [Acidimicrobiales bacterium]